MPRFVILEHDHPWLHWDLMLEEESWLRTWRLAAPPEPGGETAAEPLGNHRRAYLDYEGPVSGNRGSVTRWDSGDFTWLQDEPGRVHVELHGSRYRGQLQLLRVPDGGWKATCS
jgi:DNA polymerase Ligase (LigD)